MFLPFEIWIAVARHVHASIEPLSRVDKHIRKAVKRVQKERHDAMVKTYKAVRDAIDVSELIQVIKEASVHMKGMMHLVCNVCKRLDKQELIRHPDVIVTILTKYPDSCELDVFVRNFEGYLYDVDIYSVLLQHQYIKNHATFIARLLTDMILDLSEYITHNNHGDTQKILDMLVEVVPKMRLVIDLPMESLCVAMRQFWNCLADLLCQSLGDPVKQRAILHFMDQRKLAGIMHAIWNMCDTSTRPSLDLVMWRSLEALERFPS